MTPSPISQALRAIAAAQQEAAKALVAIAEVVEGCGITSLQEIEVAKGQGQGLLTVRQVAQRLQMSESHVYRELEEGRLGKVKIGSSVRIAEDDLARYINSCRIEAVVVGLRLADHSRGVDT